MSKLQDCYKAYCKGFEMLSERRNDFNETAKQTINDALNEIKQEANAYNDDNFRLHVVPNVLGKNFESVCLLMGHIPDGIEIDNHMQVEIGAQLIFSLANSGRIHIWGKGHVDEIAIGERKSKAPTMDFGSILPSEATKEIVHNYVFNFFNWSLTTSIRSLNLTKVIEDVSGTVEDANRIEQEKTTENIKETFFNMTSLDLTQKNVLECVKSILSKCERKMEKEMTEQEKQFRGRQGFEEALLPEHYKEPEIPDGK